MRDEELALKYIQKASTRSHRFSISILLIFVITSLAVLFGGIFIAKTEEQAYAFAYYGLPIGLGMLFLVYLINWFYCYSFLKRVKELQIEDVKLRRLLSLNKASSIFFMIPITVPIGMLGFQKVKVFSKDTYRRGTLDEILYKLFIAKEEDSVLDRFESKLDVNESKYIKIASLLTKIGGSVLIIISLILLIRTMIFPMEMGMGGKYIKATIWEFSTYPTIIGAWLILLISMLVVGLTGLITSKMMKAKPSIPMGVILIILGVPTISVFGSGLLYIIAGIQVILVKRAEAS